MLFILLSATIIVGVCCLVCLVVLSLSHWLRLLLIFLVFLIFLVLLLLLLLLIWLAIVAVVVVLLVVCLVLFLGGRHLFDWGLCLRNLNLVKRVVSLLCCLDLLLVWLCHYSGLRVQVDLLPLSLLGALGFEVGRLSLHLCLFLVWLGSTCGRCRGLLLTLVASHLFFKGYIRF